VYALLRTYPRTSMPTARGVRADKLEVGKLYYLDVDKATGYGEFAGIVNSTTGSGELRVSFRNCSSGFYFPTGIYDGEERVSFSISTWNRDPGVEKPG